MCIYDEDDMFVLVKIIPILIMYVVNVGEAMIRLTLNDTLT
jgi:hypothetical protein